MYILLANNDVKVTKKEIKDVRTGYEPTSDCHDDDDNMQIPLNSIEQNCINETTIEQENKNCAFIVGSICQPRLTRVRRCDQQDCGKIESRPREFPVCQQCKSDLKRFTFAFEKSVYCSEDCYKLDWKLRHRRFHKELRRKWRKEIEGEEEGGTWADREEGDVMCDVE